jgi:hypothetical protein
MRARPSVARHRRRRYVAPHGPIRPACFRRPGYR